MVSYNRFVELQQKALLPMVIFLKMMRLGSATRKMKIPIEE